MLCGRAKVAGGFRNDYFICGQKAINFFFKKQKPEVFENTFVWTGPKLDYQRPRF